MKSHFLGQIAVIFALVFVTTSSVTLLAKKHKFPYVGTWQGGMAAAPAYGSRLSFYNDGSCSYTSTSPRWNNPHQCSYVMQGSRALLTTIMKNRDRTRSRYRDIVLPQNKGLTLSYKPLGITGLDSTGKAFYYHRFTEPAYVLRKVK